MGCKCCRKCGLRMGVLGVVVMMVGEGVCVSVCVDEGEGVGKDDKDIK